MKARDRYDSLLRFYAEKHGMDWLALKAQMLAESNADPSAASPVGAAGLLQFMLPTWIEWHNRIHPGGVVTSRLDPERSIELGAAYMAWLAERLGRDWRLARAAFNWGIGNVKRAATLTNYRIILPDDRLPPETRAYLARIDRLYTELEAA